MPRASARRSSQQLNEACGPSRDVWDRADRQPDKDTLRSRFRANSKRLLCSAPIVVYRDVSLFVSFPNLGREI